MAEIAVILLWICFQVVELVKKSANSPICAAVGDGANDVSMIQEANVGIGIFGKEGRNAARSADFAIARFKFLRQLLLVHGYLYYTRTAYLVQYFFYKVSTCLTQKVNCRFILFIFFSRKNFFFSVTQVYFAFYNAFSQTSIYNSLFLIFINIAFNSVPIFFYGLTEQKVRIKKIENNPFYYRYDHVCWAFEFYLWATMSTVFRFYIDYKDRLQTINIYLQYNFASGFLLVKSFIFGFFIRFS